MIEISISTRLHGGEKPPAIEASCFAEATRFWRRFSAEVGRNFAPQAFRHIGTIPCCRVASFLFTFARRLSADDIVYENEISSDLLTWSAGSSVLIENMQNGGVLSETHRITAIAGQPRFFVRLRASAR